MLFNEPKLLKLHSVLAPRGLYAGFSALQRAEIAEIEHLQRQTRSVHRFSALQRAEIAEITTTCVHPAFAMSFSALQRAEIAEIQTSTKCQ